MSEVAFNQNMLGSLLRKAGAAYAQGQHKTALAAYENALRLGPTDETAMFGAASCHNALGNLTEAAELFERLAEAYPGKPVYQYNHGYSLLLDARYDAAARILRESAKRINDPHVKANLAVALQYASDRDLVTARTLLEEAAVALPNDADVQGNLAYLRLLMGSFEAGWQLHERRAILQTAIANSPVPLWDGESLQGKTLLLWHEQGFGDSLQFVRYLPLVARRAAAEGGRILFQPPQSLYRLFATSFGALAPGVSILSQAEPVGHFDLHCSLLSLPQRMHTTLATVPADIPYLHPAPVAVAQWQNRLAAIRGLKVGLVWGADVRNEYDLHVQRAGRRKSTTLEELSQLFELPGVVYFSLQKGEPANHARAFAGHSNFFDYSDELQDFADTAALTVNLDLVITVDTSVCHLAGGLGREVWVLNRRDACWRWLLGRDDSPWYPTLTQYRQTNQGDWSDVIARIAHDLRRRS